MDMFAPHGAIRSTLWPACRKNIHFTHAIVVLALLGHQTSHSQNKLFFPWLHNILFFNREFQFHSNYARYQKCFIKIIVPLRNFLDFSSKYYDSHETIKTNYLWTPIFVYWKYSLAHCKIWCTHIKIIVWVIIIQLNIWLFILKRSLVLCVQISFEGFFGDFEALFREIGTMYVIQSIAPLSTIFDHLSGSIRIPRLKNSSSFEAIQESTQSLASS